MRLILVGVIQDIDKHIVGYRILDVDSKGIKDVPVNNVIDVLKAKKVKIEGIEYRGGKVVGVNGRVERYPQLLYSVNGITPITVPLIILAQYIKDGDVIGYQVTNWKGDIVNVKVEDVIKYGKAYGVANGAIKKLQSGIEIVSAIQGEYDKLVIKDKESSLQKSERGSVNDWRSEFETSIWTLEDFEKYMKANNYEYTISKTIEGTQKIEFKCPAAKLLKYPVEIHPVILNFDPNYYAYYEDLEEIVISPCIEKIYTRFINEAPNLRKLYFQDGIKSLDLIGLKGIGYEDNLQEIRFPRTLKVLKNGLSGFSNIKEIDLSNTSLEYIDNCIDKLDNLKVLKLPNTLKVISASFNGLTSLEEITIPPSVEEITRQSFYQCSSLKRLDLSNTKIRVIECDSFAMCSELEEVIFPETLEVIGMGSFSYTKLKKLDLRHCKKLKSIGLYAFEGCSQLKEVYLPEGLKSINYRAFSGCKLEKLELPTTLTDIGSDAFSGTNKEEFWINSNMERVGCNVFTQNTTIIFDESNVTVKRRILSNNSCERVLLSNTIKVIEEEAFNQCGELQLVKLSHNLEVIEDRAFCGCVKLQTINLHECTNLKVIGEGAFKHCARLRRLVLPEGLKEIKDGAFEGCSNLKYVVIPRSVEVLGRGIFKDAIERTTYSGTVYVYNDSPALKYCKRYRLKYIVINSLEDVEKLENRGMEGTDEKSEAKLMLVLANNALHKELLDSKFKHNAMKLYKIYNYITSPMTIRNDVELNTSKYVDINLLGIDYLSSLIPIRGNKQQILETNSLTNRFKSLSNYLTLATDFNKYVLDGVVINYLKDKLQSNEAELIKVYEDGNSGIYSIYIKDLGDGDVRCVVIIVVIGSSIVYVTAIDYNDYDIVSRVFISQYSSTNLNNPISDYLGVVDRVTVSYYTTTDTENIGGMQYPKYIWDKIRNSVYEHFIMISSSTRALNTRKDIDLNVRFLCLDTGRVFETVSSVTSRCSKLVSMTNLNSFFIKDISDINSLNKEAIKDIMKEVNTTYSEHYFKYLVEGSQLGKGYDTTPSYEWLLSKEFYEKGLHDINKLTIEDVKKIFNTGFFVKATKKVLELDRYDGYFSNIIGGRIHYYTLTKRVKSKKLINGSTVNLTILYDDNNNMLDAYLSFKEFVDVLSDIWSLYLSVGDRELAISDTIYSSLDYRSSYLRIQRPLSYDTYIEGDRYNVELAISKENGGIYLLGLQLYDKRNICRLFRFKNLQDAMEWCSWMHKSDRMPDVLDKLGEIAHSIFTNGQYEVSEYNQYYLARKAILAGKQNGEPLLINDLEFWDIVAKQPQRQ